MRLNKEWQIIPPRSSRIQVPAGGLAQRAPLQIGLQLVDHARRFVQLGAARADRHVRRPVVALDLDGDACGWVVVLLDVAVQLGRDVQPPGGVATLDARGPAWRQSKRPVALSKQVVSFWLPTTILSPQWKVARRSMAGTVAAQRGVKRILPPCSQSPRSGRVRGKPKFL